MTTRDKSMTCASDATGQFSRLARPAAGPFTDLLYDGRGFLTKAAGELPVEASTAAAGLSTRDEILEEDALIFADDFGTGDTCRWSLTVGSSQPLTCPTPIPVVTHALYSSDGLLHHLRDEGTGEETFVFYFAGRPVAQLVRDGDPESDTYHWLATDHLGTPIAKIVRGTTTTLPWLGGFEPFGADWQAGTPQGASENGVLLRLPGQWMDGAWEESSLSAEVYYNVHRWYEAQAGRYTEGDRLIPISAREPNPFRYALSNPLRAADPLGLYSVDPSCNCKGCPDVEPNLRRACDIAKQPKCAIALAATKTKPMGMGGRSTTFKDCFKRRCELEPRRDFPRVYCVQETADCAKTNLLTGAITLFCPGGGGCPRTGDQRHRKRDWAQTLFHELGHTCGAPGGIPEPDWWLDLLEICTGHRQ